MLIVQTDIMDLLGSDLPIESEDGIKFAWSDGILLQVKMQYWNLISVVYFVHVLHFSLDLIC